MSEIIDLTGSPPREVIEISSDRENTSRGPNSTQGTKTRRKKKKGKTSNGLASDGADSLSVQPSRAHSPPGNGNQHAEHGESTSHHGSGSPPPRALPSTIDEPGLFIFDGAAASIAEEDRLTEPPPESDSDDRLLLPSHVTIFDEDGSIPTEVLPPPKLSLDEEYIEYLDYDYRKAPGLVRYFEAKEEESNRSIFKCKNCGAESDHKTFECPIQICLTCGARDEHSTRSCPISKTCYSCGMKGHINKTCPNRFSAHSAPSDYHSDCDRCGSTEHKMNECPTLWRIYQYVNDEERILITQSRKEKKLLAIGEGGEGYIGEEMWCHNCANTGHLGDDCDELPHPSAYPIEHSAFSLHNIMSGPFYDPAVELVPEKRRPRERRTEVHWDAGLPIDVGKRGKNKDKEKLEKRFREQEDEGEDWFDDMRNVKRRGRDQQAPPPNLRGKKTLKIGFKDGGRSSPNKNGGASLLERIGDAPGGRGSRDTGDRGREGPSHENILRIRGAASEQRRHDDRYGNSRKTEWEGDRDKSRRGHGPRYRGSYDLR